MGRWVYEESAPSGCLIFIVAAVIAAVAGPHVFMGCAVVLVLALLNNVRN